MNTFRCFTCHVTMITNESILLEIHGGGKGKGTKNPPPHQAQEWKMPRLRLLISLTDISDNFRLIMLKFCSKTGYCQCNLPGDIKWPSKSFQAWNYSGPEDYENVTQSGASQKLSRGELLLSTRSERSAESIVIRSREDLYGGEFEIHPGNGRANIRYRISYWEVVYLKILT